MNSEQPRPRIYSVGHSTRTAEDLIALLEENGIATVADIRRFPGSRRHPQFSRENLEARLPMRYVHLEALGGRRDAVPGSLNTAWRHDSFRGYADHMASETFRQGVDRLVSLPAPVAFLCAEAVPWRCHRNLVSDELDRRGWQVVHILGPGQRRIHQRNPAAVDAGGFLIYPDRQQRLR